MTTAKPPLSKMRNVRLWCIYDILMDQNDEMSNKCRDFKEFFRKKVHSYRIDTLSVMKRRV